MFPLFVSIGRLRILNLYENDERHVKVMSDTFDKVLLFHSQ
jgi:hypothetical protein